MNLAAYIIVIFFIYACIIAALVGILEHLEQINDSISKKDCNDISNNFVKILLNPFIAIKYIMYLYKKEKIYKLKKNNKKLDKKLNKHIRKQYETF